MMTCIICRFDVELDDVAIGSAHERCVCLRCYGRETGTSLAMPKTLQRELAAALAEAEAEQRSAASGSWPE